MKSMKLTIGSPIIKLTFRMMSIAPDPKQGIASDLYPLVTTVLKLLSQYNVKHIVARQQDTPRPH